MVNIAVLGNGTVGSGVVEVMSNYVSNISEKAGEKIKVKYILERPDYPEALKKENMVFDFNTILEDDEVEIVVEVIGGLSPAYEFVKKSLQKGKSVVTSNKALVAEYGKELMDIAADKNVNFLIGASVGGGIPVLRPMNVSLTADIIKGIDGILNGTTNFILTQMYENDMSFEEALKLAQNNGYAELNPEADVEGHDTTRKIAILLSLATGKRADYKKISCEGITKITKEHMEKAKALNCDIKLLAFSRVCDDGAYAFVSPVLVSKEHPLNNVRDVFNAVLIHGEITGDVMFYGQGAGKLPTASAVIADIIDCVKNKGRAILKPWADEELKIKDNGDLIFKEFIAFDKDAKDIAEKYFKNIEFISGAGENTAFIIESMARKDIDSALSSILSENVKITERLPLI